MIRASLAGFLGAMVLVGSAAAANCPPGQFYRVRLKLCVGGNTSLALAYVHVAPSRPPGAEPEAIPGGKSEMSPRSSCQSWMTGRHRSSVVSRLLGSC